MSVCGSVPFGYATRPYTLKMRFFYNFRIGSKLDFIHLHINKMQGKLCLYSAKRKDRADLAKRIYHDP